MLTYRGTTRTWAEHHRRSSQVAHALLSDGVSPQDRVAFLDRNSVAYFEVLFGAAQINAVPVPVNWRLSPGEMADIINDAEPGVLIVDRSFAGPVAEFEARLRTVRRIVVIGGDGGDGGDDGDDAGPPGHGGYEDWLAGRPADDPGAEPAPDEVAIRLYTSGTTGLPKGVMLTNRNLDAGQAACGSELEIGAGDVNLVAMPLFHIGGTGWALMGLARGVHTVVEREVDPEAILAVMGERRVSHVFLVPAAIMMLLGAPGCATADLTALRYVVYGASPISERVLTTAMDAFGCEFVQLYGMTETTGAITRLRPEEHDPHGPHPNRLRSCGMPFDGVELRVVEPATGGDAPSGCPGELWTRSVQNMKGYWHNPEATAATIGPDGWLRTGDVAYLDADGFVYLHDRVKDMIVTGGENVYPAEVENALMSHPAVADCAVFGIPSEQWGEEVKAVVVVSPGGRVTPDELIAFTRGRIAGYKVPRSIDFAVVLPRNPSGKVLKKELREPYWKGLDRRIH
jgi:long-chain acyl-CoA synthetase